MYKHIPAELKKLKQWVCWQAVPDEARQGKIKKIPINALTGGQAQSNNSETWTDYETAFKASAKFTGLGFMFGNGYFGVDIDGVENAIDDYRNNDADNIISEFIHTLHSYSEYSHSGNGLHIICKGKLPPNGRRKNNVEMYSEGRYFVMTGNIAAEYMDIAECTETIKTLHEKYIGAGREPALPSSMVRASVSLSENEIIEAAKKSKQGTIFTDLFNGSWGNYFPSQSEADMSFCNMLAFWCGKNESVMDSIFRKSGLMRDKWDRKQSGSTYGLLTIANAVKSCEKVYEPHGPRDDNFKVIFNAGNTKEEKKKFYTFDDTGNAERFVDIFSHSVRYSYIDKAWYYYDERRWLIDYTGTVKRLIDKTVDSMRLDKEIYKDVGEEFEKHIKRTRSNKSKTAMLKESEHRVPILPEQLDRHGQLLNTPNGILNLRTGELMQHDADKYLTKIVYTEYTDKADCPLWKKFLTEIFNNDTELIKYVQKAVGYSLTASNQEQCVFFCYGTGQNGKSTFLDIISDMLGDYAVNIQPETIMVKQQSSGANSDVARLKGARFVTTVEPNEGVRLNEGLLKQLSGGDKITARKQYGSEFEFTAEFKLWMGTNHKPVIRGTDIGIWRRIHLIPFDAQIPEHKKDARLKYKLRQELPAILKWAVDGCLLWQREGLKKPESVEAATKDYKSEMDTIGAFLEACTSDSVGREKASDVFAAYVKWADDNNEYKMSNTKFGREMAKRLNKVRKEDCIYYIGVVLNEDCKGYNVKFGK